MDTTVKKYVTACEVCIRIKAPRHAKYGLNMAIEPPTSPWKGVTMDFVTDLPESTNCKYTGILVVIDRFIKIAVYIPCQKDIDSLDAHHYRPWNTFHIQILATGMQPPEH